MNVYVLVHEEHGQLIKKECLLSFRTELQPCVVKTKVVCSRTGMHPRHNATEPKF